MKFTDHIIASQAQMIHYVSGMDGNGLPAYFFVRIKDGMERHLHEALVEGNCNLEQYGQIIHSGFGILTDDDKVQLTEQYGFSFDLH